MSTAPIVFPPLDLIPPVRTGGSLFDPPNDIFYNTPSISATAPYIITANYTNTGNYVWPINGYATDTTGSVTTNVQYFAIPTAVTGQLYEYQFNGQFYCSVSVNSPPATPEQQAIWAAEELARNIKTESASKRAEELLLAVLPAKQKQQYLEKGYFDTEIGDKIYRINKGWSGNVKLIEKKKEVASFCIHPVEFLPHQDNMLAQYLMLRTDEGKFLAKANKTTLYMG